MNHQDQPGPYASVNEEDLIQLAQLRDEAAFAELIRRTSPAPIRQAMLILRNREEAEDEVQNSCLKAWQYIGSFQGQARFSTWLLRIVVNQCLMRLRQLHQRKYVYLDGGAVDAVTWIPTIYDRGPSPELRYDHHQRSALLGREIRRLPPIVREVLVLRDIEELTAIEVSARLGLSISAVKSRLLRARAMLRLRLNGGRAFGIPSRACS